MMPVSRARCTVSRVRLQPATPCTLPPDVNFSRARFAPEHGAIRFGLAAVRNVGGAVMEAMVQERTQNGKFANFFDFCDRVDGLNKRMLEALISAGCFDSMGGKRAQYLAVY